MGSTVRYAVVGTGANGAAVAADLARAGRDVTLIDQWPENVAAIRANGIDVRIREQRFVVQAPTFNLCDVARMRERFDVVLIMVKSYDTAWATRLIEPLLAPDGIAIGVQNGMTMKTIAEIVSPARTLGCVIECGGAMYTPGIVERDTPHELAWFAVGHYDQSTKGREEVGIEALRHSGNVEFYPDIRAAKWMKLVVNCAEVAPSAVLGLSMKAAIETPGVRDFMLEAGCEAISVLRQANIDILPVFGIPDLDPDDPRAFVGKLLDTVIYSFGQPGSRVASLQDWMKGRRSEIDDMNGEIVRKGCEIGHPTPYNKRALEIALRIEAGGAEPSLSNLEPMLEALR